MAMSEITNEVAARVLDTVDAGLRFGTGVAEPGKMCIEEAVCYALGMPHGDNPACVSHALRSFMINLNDALWSSNEERAKGLRRLALVQLDSAGYLNDREFARRVAELAIRKAVPAAMRSAASIQKDPWRKASLLEHAAICEREGTRTATRDAAAAAYAAYAEADATADYDAAPYAAYAAAAAAYAATTAAVDADADAAAAAYETAAAYADTAAANAAAAAAYAAAIAADYDATGGGRVKSLADFAEAVVQVLIEMEVPGVKWLSLAPAEVVA